MQKLWYLIGSLVLLVAVAIAFRGGQHQPVVAESESSSPTAVVATPTPTAKPIAKPRVTTKRFLPSYAEVSGQYEKRQIQFDTFCQALPVESSFIPGTEIMLDNRSPDDRVVAIGGEQHGLSGYGWKIVTLTTIEVLPATLAIDCGVSKNVGKITLELPVSTNEPLVTPASSSDPLASASVSPSLEPTP